MIDQPDLSTDTHTTEETELWTGGPSHLIAWQRYAISILLLVGGIVGAFWWIWALIATAIGVILGLWSYLDIRCHQYLLTTERLTIKRGILNRHTDELELFRVKDFQMTEPLWMRIFGLGNVVLVTTDATTARITLGAIRQADFVRNALREHVNRVRRQRGVRELDIE